MVRKIISLLMLSTLTISIYAGELLTIYQNTLRNNPLYRSTIFQIAKQSALHNEALSAFLPHLEAKAGIGYDDATTHLDSQLSYLPTIPKKTHASITSDAITVKLTQTVFDYASWEDLHATSYLKYASVVGRKKMRQQLSYNLLEQYLQLIELRQQYQYIKTEKEQIQQEYNIAENRYHLGTATKLYLSQAKLKLEAILLEEQDLKNQTKITIQKLMTLSGGAVSPIERINFSMKYLLPLPDKASYWEQKAIVSNPSMIAERYKLAAARKEISSATGAMLPKVVAEVRYNNIHTAAPVFQGIRENSTEAVIGVEVPIVQGGEGIAKRRKAQAAYGKYYYEYIDARNQVKLAAQNLLTDANDLGQKLKTDQESLKAARSAVENSLTAYQQGLAGIKDFLDAESSLFEARSTYVNDLTNFVLIKAKLVQLTGGLNYSYMNRLDQLDLLKG